jgi:hypothetical protein
LGKGGARAATWGGGSFLAFFLLSKNFGAAAFLLAAIVGGALFAFAASRMLAGNARKLMRSTCAAPGPALEYKGWDGVSHELVFTSKPYFEAFLAANETKRISTVRTVERLQEAGA